MHQATLRVAGKGAYAAATAGTDATAELWCNDHCDLLHVRGDADDLVGRVGDTVGVRERIDRDDETLVVTDACLDDHAPADHQIETYLARHDCLLVPPLRYEHGAKRCRVVALDPANLTGCYRDLVDAGADVDVVSKREVDGVPAASPVLSPGGLLPELTERQRQAALLAVEEGYYDRPRATRTAELANVVGVDRRTFEEHLRRAERKLLTAVAELL